MIAPVLEDKELQGDHDSSHDDAEHNNDQNYKSPKGHTAALASPFCIFGFVCLV